MERIEPTSSWNDPPTDVQVRTIMWYGKILHIDFTESDLPSNRLEARNLIYQLRADLKKKGKHPRHFGISERR